MAADLEEISPLPERGLDGMPDDRSATAPGELLGHALAQPVAAQLPTVDHPTNTPRDTHLADPLTPFVISPTLMRFVALSSLDPVQLEHIPAGLAVAPPSRQSLSSEAEVATSATGASEDELVWRLADEVLPMEPPSEPATGGLAEDVRFKGIRETIKGQCATGR